MSWSIAKLVGTPDKVAAVVGPQFDSAAKSYHGTAEEQDVLSAKDTVLSWLAAVPGGQVAIVEANGSRGTSWVSVHVTCTAVHVTCTAIPLLQ